MAITGKSGADAIFKALKRICIVLAHYSPKLDAVITQAQTAGKISAAQAATCRQLVTLATAFCDAYALVADFSGLTE